jgi:hypothetical protein
VFHRRSCPQRLLCTTQHHRRHHLYGAPNTAVLNCTMV